MGEISLWQASFNAGEMTGLLEGREDIAKYPSACRRLRNYNGLIQGPARRRTGTRAVTTTKANGDVWLVPFIRQRRLAYMLEFGNNYIRFYRNRGQLESSPGVPYEIVSPWTYAQLTDVDGTFIPRLVQSNDVLYICQGTGVKQLNRFADLNWTISDFDFIGGPFDAENTSAVTVYASAQTGVVTLTASAAIFTADRIGSLIRLQPQNLSSVAPWQPNVVVTSAALRRSDGKTYIQATAGVTEGSTGQRHTGTVAPIHEDGDALDGGNGTGGKIQDTAQTTAVRVDTGYNWTFSDPGYGVLKITAVGGGGTTATATVGQWRTGSNARLPLHVTTAPNATARWSWGLFSDAAGWPRAPSFFRERFVLAGSRRMAFSTPSDFNDFSQETAGQTLADNAFVVEIASDRDEDLLWIMPSKQILHVGTTGGEQAMQEQNINQAFGPLNRKIEPQTGYGSNGVTPVRIGDAPMFVEASGLRIRAVEPGPNGSLDANSQNDLAEHITRSTIIQTAYAAQPDSFLWGLRADGRLACLTYSKPQEVFGWSLHYVGGFRDAGRTQPAKVRTVAVIPNPDGTLDDLWMVVERRINGATVRFVEFLTENEAAPDRYENESEDEWQRRVQDFQADQFFVDGGITYDQPITITGATLVGGKVRIAAPAHGLSDGDSVRIDGIVGTWRVNARCWTLSGTTAGTFDLDETTVADFNTYVSGGLARELVMTISGLGAWEGEPLQILADGAVHPDRTPVGGQIELQVASGRVQIGWGYKSLIETQRPAGGNERGSAQGQLGAINSITIRLHQSLGGQVGPDEDHLDDIQFRSASDFMDLPPPLFSGDKELGWPDGFSTDRTVVFVQDQPLPSVVVGFGSDMEVNAA